MHCNLKSNIKIQSNVIIKSKAEHHIQDYIPFDLMRDEYKDSRLDSMLTKQQQKQKFKKMFAAKTIINDNQKFSDLNPEMCKNCQYKDICF